MRAEVRADEITPAERIGRRIRTIRLEREISQEELGEKVGLSSDMVQKYENGYRKPKPDRLKDIANVLAVDVRALSEPSLSEGYIGVMRFLFEVEDLYELKVKNILCVYFFTEKEVMKMLERKIRRYKLMDIHREMVKKGKFLSAKIILKLLRTGHIKLGLSDEEWEIESICEKIGCRIRYSRNFCLAEIQI